MRTDDPNNQMLPTDPPMGVGDVLEKADGVNFCIKDSNSVFLWVSQNFADLVGQSKDALIGSADEEGRACGPDPPGVSGPMRCSGMAGGLARRIAADRPRRLRAAPAAGRPSAPRPEPG